MSYPYPPAELKAPEGTKPYTPWIWLIVVLPLVVSLPALGIDWGALVDLTDTTGMSALGVYTNPLYWVMLLGGWVAYGLNAWFAYLDWRELQRRGVPKPFHFAWVFLSSGVYPIGRSVVVRRRTGTGIAPMWVTIGMLALSFALGMYIVAVTMASIFGQMAMYAV